MTWTSRPVAAAQRFRPGGWSDENTIWGLARGRIASIDLSTGRMTPPGEIAWWVSATSGAVAWRNERGTWIRWGSAAPRPAPVSRSSGESPSEALWSPDGSRALLLWDGEESGVEHALLDRDESMRPIDARLPGYYGHRAEQWLDSTRLLFRVVALASQSGDSSYRESGWRGDLALLDLATGSYARVTNAPDTTWLRPAGLFLDGLLVTEWSSAGVVRQWLYDTRDWGRRPVELPAGRAFASRGGAVVVLANAQGDSAEAILVAGDVSRPLGRTSLDAGAVFSPSGRRGVILTGDGLVLIEAR